MSSASYYLRQRGFVFQAGSYYYPATAYPHLHTGLRTIGSNYFTEPEVTWIDSRTGLQRSRVGEPQEMTYETIAFVSYHRAGQDRANPIWSAATGWTNHVDRVVDELHQDGLFTMCQMILNAFGCTREGLPQRFKF